MALGSSMGPKKSTKARMLRRAVSTVDNPVAFLATYESQEMAIVKTAPLDKRSVTREKEPGGQARRGCGIGGGKLARLQKDDGVIKIKWVYLCIANQRSFIIRNV